MKRNLCRFLMGMLMLIVTAASSNAWAQGSGEDFTIVVLPDTQIYSQKHPDIWKSQAEWIVANASALNIKMVLHLGDVVHQGAKQEDQWRNAKAAVDVIDAAGIPFFIAPGNHDYDDMASSRNATKFNQYLGIGRYAGKPWFGGVYSDESSNAPGGAVSRVTGGAAGGAASADAAGGDDATGGTENVWGIVSAGERQYLIMVLEFGPRQAVINWANQVVADHPSADVIYVTHNYMYYDNMRTGSGSKWNPHSYGIGSGGDAADGDELWDRLVRKHPNSVMALSGHILGDGLGRRTDFADNGNMVHQILSNYQMQTNGGNGALRLLRFSPEKGIIKAQTYSPYTDSFLIDADNEFVIPYNPASKAWPVASLYGKVSNLVTNEALTGAIVTIQGDAQDVAATRTDLHGYYALKAPVGLYRVSVSAARYASAETSVYVGQSGAEYVADLPLQPVSVWAGYGAGIPGSVAEGSDRDILLQNQMLSLMVADEFDDPQLAGVTRGKPVDMAATGFEDHIDWINLPYLSATKPTGTNAWKSLTVRNDTVRVTELTPDKAVVEARGAYTQAPGIQVNTTYTLNPGKEWVEVSTSIVNATDQSVSLWVGDSIDHDGGTLASLVAGATEISASSPKTFVPTQPWLGQYGDDKQVYGIVYDEDFTDCDVYAAQIWAMSRKQVVIPAGEQYVIRRWLVATALSGQTPINALSKVYQDIMRAK